MVLVFNYVSKLTIKCAKVNEAKGSSNIKSFYWFKCKNSKINIDGRCFQYGLRGHNIIKKSKTS